MSAHWIFTPFIRASSVSYLRTKFSFLMMFCARIFWLLRGSPSLTIFSSDRFALAISMFTRILSFVKSRIIRSMDRFISRCSSFGVFWTGGGGLLPMFINAPL